MLIEPEGWLAEYEESLAEAHELPLSDRERKCLLQILRWMADESAEHQGEAIRCFVISAIRSCRTFCNVLSRADAWIESAELSADPDFCETMEKAKAAELQLSGVLGEDEA